MLKLGCAYPRKEDKRRIKLSAILKEMYLPSEFDAEVDIYKKPFPGRMWLNDDYSDCVIAAQANHTRVLEYIEQGYLINITDKDVETLYKAESNGEDNGLYTLDAMNWWHSKGWDVAGGSAAVKTRGCWHKKPKPTNSQHLDIYAYAEMDSIEELYRAIYYLHGAYIAVRLTNNDIKQFKNGEIWSLKDGDTDYIGGHALDVPRFLPDGNLECWTWAKRQLMTPDWYKARVYDTVGVVDGRDNFLSNSPVDCEKLNALLLEIVNS